MKAMLIALAIADCAPRLGPKEEAEIAGHAARLVECHAHALAAADGGGKEAGLAAFDHCADGGAK